MHRLNLRTSIIINQVVSLFIFTDVFRVFSSVVTKHLITQTDVFYLSTGSSTALLDLTGLDTSPTGLPSYPDTPSLQTPSQELGISLLDDELMSLGKQQF